MFSNQEDQEDKEDKEYQAALKIMPREWIKKWGNMKELGISWEKNCG